MHDDLVQERGFLLGRLLLLQLIGRPLQPGRSGKDRALLPHVAAVQAGGRAGEGQGLLVQEGVGGAAHPVFPAAEQAGHLQVHMVVHKFHPQLRSAAGAFDMGRGGSQGKQVPLHNDRLTAGGADISQGTLWLFNRHNEFPFCGSPASAPDGPFSPDAGSLIFYYINFFLFFNSVNFTTH